jgi:hypothetical protein
VAILSESQEIGGNNMQYNITFKAPWGTPLKSMTTLSILIGVGIPLIGIFSGPRGDIGWILGMIIMPLAILIIAAFFMIRGYDLTGDTLLIRRLGWNSKLDLSRLISADVDSKAMTKSIRAFGNGGMFCFAGLFYNKKLGSYRAFATDPKRSVVLRFSNRVAVVTPDDPAEFTARVKELRGL